MNVIRTPVTLSPHFVKGKPGGYYVVVTRLFPNGNPPLLRRQFVGVGRHLILSVGRNNTWDSVIKMQVNVPKIDGEDIIWLSSTKLYPINMGFRVYIPGRVWKPKSAEARKVQTIGEFRRFEFGTTDLFYLEVPKVTKNVIYGTEDL